MTATTSSIPALLDPGVDFSAARRNADRMGTALFLAIVTHLFVVLGVSFVYDKGQRDLSSSIDVVLVQRKSESTPEDARHWAQANSEGGGESAEPEIASTPLPAPLLSNEAALVSAAPPQPEVTPVAVREPDPVVEEPAASQAPAEAAPPVPVLSSSRETDDEVVPTDSVQSRPEPRVREQAVARESVPSERQVDAQRVPKRTRAQEVPATPPVPARNVDAATLLQRSRQIAALSARVDMKLKAYSERPRRRWISARTREHRYASYMEAWRAKVERIGNLNYPQAARDRRLSGTLLLDVALKADGTIHDMTIRRSSGKQVLDDAAMNIVRLAAPFARFPESIRKETDILHIERTWSFETGQHFSSR